MFGSPCPRRVYTAASLVRWRARGATHCYGRSCCSSMLPGVAYGVARRGGRSAADKSGPVFGTVAGFSAIGDGGGLASPREDPAAAGRREGRASAGRKEGASTVLPAARGWVVMAITPGIALGILTLSPDSCRRPGIADVGQSALPSPAPSWPSRR